MTVLENVKRLLRQPQEQRGTVKSTSIEVHEKKPSKDTDVLNFQPEPHAPFEQEPTYDTDVFQKNDRTVEKILTPPPNFKKALTQIPQPLKEAFKEILNGELVGVWPIGSDCLRK